MSNSSSKMLPVVQGYVTDCQSCAIGHAAGEGADGRCPLVCRTRQAGAFLYIEGQQADQVHFVKRGMVVLSRDAGERRGAVAWTVRRPGTLIGSEALVQGAYNDTARTALETWVCAAPIARFETWLRDRQGAARAMLDVTLRTLRTDAPRRAGSDGNALQRVAAWLLSQDANDPARQLQRQVVAELLGMLPETLSRALGMLAREGAIDVDRKSVRITDAARLESVANADDGTW